MLFMELGVTLFVVLVLVVAVWLIFKVKGFQHKFVTIFLVVLILLSFTSFYLAFHGKDVSIENFSDLDKITKLYFSWLGGVFNNMKVLTTQAIDMNWQGNKTIS